MFKIFADAHKKIASELYDNVYDIYGVKLDKDKLLWGSVLPDIMPQYKLIRHYKDESIDYISREIMKIIFFGRHLDLGDRIDPMTMRILSKRIGIVSHYLTDYVCLPHAKRWMFTNGKEDMLRHLKYESRLEEIVKTHDFKKNMINVDDLNIYDMDNSELKSNIKTYIENVVEEYSIKEGYENDLNFALSINGKLTYFIIDTIKAYSEELQGHFAFEF